MQISKLTTSALFMSLASNVVAVPAPNPQAANTDIVASQSVTLTGKKVDGTFVKEPAPSTPDSQALQKRGAIIVVAGIAGTAALAKVAQIAIEIGADTIKNLGEWNEAREAFTKATTQAMWDRNPDYAKFPAVACYNKGYRLANPANVDAVASVKFDLGLLNTEYVIFTTEASIVRVADMGLATTFFTDSEGGYINLSYTYNPERCSFDQKTGDLSCS
ncbi:hypothetical protein F5X68DRAFT_187403 [Plectosphaerella plurivora]|uniref:DUF7888 domain-containing protein n=1 Tax=Plectosphaerella plurivora TaxID=936078 RepID=A0A9P9AFG1_9PEZI|nr:hypothetical protein F5X68DRAFT_187403 [Plectosphaerella plurivora]